MPDLDRIVAGLRCRDVLQLLGDYVDGTLDDDRVGRIHGHLRDCDACEKFGGEYASLVAALRRSLDRKPVATGVRARLTDRMTRFWESA